MVWYSICKVLILSTAFDVANRASYTHINKGLYPIVRFRAFVLYLVIMKAAIGSRKGSMWGGANMVIRSLAVLVVMDTDT